MGDFSAVFERSAPQPSPSSANDSRLLDLNDFPLGKTAASSSTQPINRLVSPSLYPTSHSAEVSGLSIGQPGELPPTGLESSIRPRSENGFHPHTSTNPSMTPCRTPDLSFSIPTKRPRLDSTSSGAAPLSPPFSGLASVPPETSSRNGRAPSADSASPSVSASAAATRTTLQMNQMVELMIPLTDRVSSFQDDVDRRLAALEASQRRVEERRNDGEGDDGGGNTRVARIKELERERERQRDEVRWTTHDEKMEEMIAMQAEIWRKLATLGKDYKPESSPQSRNRNREELVDGLAEQVTSQVSEMVEQHLGTITRMLEEQMEAMSRRVALRNASAGERRSGNRGGSMPVSGGPARSGSQIGRGSHLRLGPSAYSPAPASARSLQSGWQPGAIATGEQSVAPSETGSGAGILQDRPSVSQDSIPHHVRDDFAGDSVPNPYSDDLHGHTDASPSLSAGLSLSALRKDAGLSNHVDPRDVMPRERQRSVGAHSSGTDEDVTGFSEVHTHPPLQLLEDVEPDVSMVTVDADADVSFIDALEGADDESDSQPLSGRLTSVDGYPAGMQLTHDNSDREEEAQNAVETVLGDLGYEHEPPDEEGSGSDAGAEGEKEGSAMRQASGSTSNPLNPYLTAAPDAPPPREASQTSSAFHTAETDSQPPTATLTSSPSASVHGRRAFPVRSASKAKKYTGHPLDGMRMTRHMPSTTKFVRVDKHGIKSPAIPNAGGRRRQSTSRSETQSQSKSQSRLSQNEEGVSILVKKGIGRTLVKSGQKAGRKSVGGSQANGFADRMRISRGCLARSDGLPRGGGDWPFKGPNTRKGRLQEVTCVVCQGRCHWSCAGLLKTDDAEGFQDWQCPDCQHAKKIGTSAAEIQLAPPDRCIRAKCILRENRKYDDEEGDEDEFVVERIVGRRAIARKEGSTERIFQFLVKWAGYPIEQSTWEPRENIDGDSLIQQFRAEVEAAGQSTKPRVVILPEGCKCWDELSGDLKEEYRVAENESEGDTDGDSQSEDED